jgi:hypothetical protein
VHKNVAVATCLLDEIVGLVEEFIQLILLVILGRQVEVKRDVLTTVLHEATSGHRQNSLDSLGWIRGRSTVKERDILSGCIIGDKDGALASHAFENALDIAHIENNINLY